MKKTKIIGLLAGLAALAVAVPAVGAPPAGKGKERAAEARAKGIAKRTCQLERADIGREAFREKYGDGEKGQHAMRNCKRSNGAQILAASSDAVDNCKAARDADPDAFRDQYGSHGLGKCVSSSVKNAAKECKAEREADAAAFDDTYGTNHNDRNAFGKCVSEKVNEEPEPEPTV